LSKAELRHSVVAAFSRSEKWSTFRIARQHSFVLGTAVVNNNNKEVMSTL
jgi:hypothetical protein